MRCPKCGLDNPPEAEVCDCKYVFATGMIQQAPSNNQASSSDPWAVIAHLCVFLNFIFGLLGFIAALAIYLVFRGNNEFVNAHLRAALNFQITLLIPNLMAIFFLIFAGVTAIGGSSSGVGIGAVGTIGSMVIGVGFNLIGVIFGIIGALKASKNLPYSYPITLTFVRR